MACQIWPTRLRSATKFFRKSKFDLQRLTVNDLNFRQVRQMEEVDYSHKNVFLYIGCNNEELVYRHPASCVSVQLFT
jgi:hypothetical protein